MPPSCVVIVGGDGGVYAFVDDGAENVRRRIRGGDAASPEAFCTYIRCFAPLPLKTTSSPLPLLELRRLSGDRGGDDLELVGDGDCDCDGDEFADRSDDREEHEDRDALLV